MKTNVCVSPIPHYLSFLCFLFIFHRPNHFIIVSNWRNVSASSFFSSLYYFSEILYIFLNIPCASGDDKKSPIQSFWKKFNVKKCYILDISEIQISLNTPGDGKAICSRCVGSAPLAYVTKGKLRVKAGKKLRNPSSLFKKPQTAGLKKTNFDLNFYLKLAHILKIDIYR
ncbi:hypothetical protein B9Z55_003493 [Caenorhabditis nigoni]|uniref:Uncharacterized protein n=1 Tax=Caenorhabditis nigoni TaxID=1611254 RepID=A0A2G5VQR3_9PELO|nr:hypothetical protein B9Z55_003493 [Caenorhabditis nigoni]